MPIPRYYGLSVSTGTNCPHDTSLTSTPSHLLCFHFVFCVKEVSRLINRPVVLFLDTRVGDTSAEVVPQGVNLKLPVFVS
jgi:hypothetical protein